MVTITNQLSGKTYWHKNKQMISFDNRNLERTLISSHRDGKVLMGTIMQTNPQYGQCARVPSLTIWLQSGEWLIGNSLPYHLELERMVYD